MTKELDKLVSLAAEFEDKYSVLPPPKAPEEKYTILPPAMIGEKEHLSPSRIYDIKRSIDDLNHLYDSLGNQSAHKSLIHFVVKRLDAILYGLQKK